MPKNIFNFTLKYLSSTLAARETSPNGASQSSACSFCLQSETLQHIVSSCKSYFEQGRYTLRHDSVLNFIADTLSGLQSCSIYADLPALLYLSLITGNSLRPDLILISKNNDLYILFKKINFDKCLRFGIKKAATSLNQCFPKLIVNNSLDLTVGKICPLISLVDTSISKWIVAIICHLVTQKTNFFFSIVLCHPNFLGTGPL